MGSAPEALAEQPLVPKKHLGARDVANRIMRASAIYGVANFGVRGLNFLLLPIYTRYLTPADYGMIALAETLAGFMLQIVNMGFDTSIQRLYFQHVDSGDELSSYIGSALKFAFAVEAIFLILIFALGPWMQQLFWAREVIPFLYIAMASVTAAGMQFFNYRLILYQAEQRPRLYALLAFLSFGLIATSCIALVVFAHLGVKGMLCGKLFASLICLTIATVIGWPALRSHFQWQYIRNTIAVGVPLVPHQLMAVGLMSADRFVLAHYRSLHEVGIYSVGYTFGMAMSLVTTSLNQAWAPIYYETARTGQDGRRILGKMCSGIITVLIGIACCGALFSRDFMMRFLDKRFEEAVTLVPWIIGAYLMHSLFSMFALTALQARKTKVIMLASFVALTVNTVLNFALIPKLGMYGAAYATLLAYISEALVMYVLAQRIFPLEYDLPRTFSALALFAAVLTVTQLQWSASIRPFVITATAIGSLGLLAASSLNWVKRYLHPDK